MIFKFIEVIIINVYIQIIKDVHEEEINGITELKDGSIATYTNEKIVNICSL